MVYIDDAGTGCILGVPVVVGLKAGKVASVPMKDLKGATALEEVFEVMGKLGVTKDEEIKICRGNVFDRFAKTAVAMGYKVERIAVEGDFQDLAEQVFMESIYALGVSRTVKLEGKDYNKFQQDIRTEIVLKPELMQYVRPHYLLNRGFTRIVHKVTRLQNEFPHLYAELKTVI